MGDPRRILAVKLADIGDAIGTLPALRALRAAFPDATIDALVTPGPAREIFAHEPAVTHVRTLAKGAFGSLRGLADPRALGTLAGFTAELRRERYDAVVFFHHLTTAGGAAKYHALALATGAPLRAGLDNGRGTFLTHATHDHGFGARPEWRYWLDVAGTLGAASLADSRPTIAPPATAFAWARALVPVDEPYVVLHPGVGAFSPARQWPPARLAAVGAMLAAAGYALVITGGTDNEARDASAALRTHLGGIRATDLTGAADMMTTAAIYTAAALWVGSDNGMAHLAAATNAPSIVVFGPSNHRAWAPYGAIEWHPGDDSAMLPAGTRVVVLRDTIACSPCVYTGYTLGRPQGCPARTCLDAVHAHDVFALARQLLLHHV